MPLLELHRQSDYTQGVQGPPWPLLHVEVKGEIPEHHSFSDQFVHAAMSEGWMSLEGEPFVYECQPDPLGASTRFTGPQTITLPGDVLVMKVVRDGENIEVRWQIVRGPTPRGYRIPDEESPSGWSAPHDFEVELQA